VREGGGLKLGSRYVWGEDLSGSLQGAGGIGGLLSSVQVGAAKGDEAEGTTSFFHYDSNGNVILLTDGRGRESARYAYDAFGKTLTATGPAARGNRYRFSTKPVEEESGLVYYGFRYYDPVTGRWPSRDPIGEKGGLNVYGMVWNGVVSKIDFLGMAMTKAQCQSAVQQAMGSALALRIMAELGEQNRNGRDSSCRVPTFTCEECAYSCAVKGKPVSGLFDPSSGNIKICHDAPTQTATGVVDTIEHELVHALDTCDGCDWSECDHRACSEIRAYAAGNGLTGQTLKDAAANSVRSAPACEQNAMTHVNNVFDRCSNADPFVGYDGPWKTARVLGYDEYHYECMYSFVFDWSGGMYYDFKPRVSEVWESIWIDWEIRDWCRSGGSRTARLGEGKARFSSGYFYTHERSAEIWKMAGKKTFPSGTPFGGCRGW
jgi:RHS repeat-associated protein